MGTMGGVSPQAAQVHLHLLGAKQVPETGFLLTLFFLARLRVFEVAFWPSIPEEQPQLFAPQIASVQRKMDEF